MDEALVRLRQTLFLGWDVGGWLGKRDGLACLALDRGSRPRFLNRRVTSLTAFLSDPTLDRPKLLGVFMQDVALPTHRRWILGVDAPLSFPSDFVRLLSDRGFIGPLQLSEREIESRLAYRDSDRFIYYKTGKKVLSPAFDRLGNNATKAICLVRRLGLPVVPIDLPEAHIEKDRSAKLDAFALETYPALWKEGYRKQGRIRLDLRRATSGLDLAPIGSDESDAVLCALTALCFENDRLGRPLPSLPPLMHPEDSEPGGDADPSEGWIYAPFPPPDSP